MATETDYWLLRFIDSTGLYGLGNAILCVNFIKNVHLNIILRSN
jgi:hypothetical protein